MKEGGREGVKEGGSEGVKEGGRERVKEGGWYMTPARTIARTAATLTKHEVTVSLPPSFQKKSVTTGTYQVCPFLVMVDVVVEADELPVDKGEQSVEGAASRQHKHFVLGSAVVLTGACG